MFSVEERLLSVRALLLGHVPRHPAHDPEHAEPAAKDAEVRAVARREMFWTGVIVDLVERFYGTPQRVSSATCNFLLASSRDQQSGT